MKKFALPIIICVSSCTIAPRINVSGVPAFANTVIDGKIYSTAYQQHAAEYRALCLQAYNIARLRVDEAVHENSPKPKALITDIDETILNNSPYEAHQVLQGKDYESNSWNEWTAIANADTIAGAYSFLKYAAAKGIEVFYVTNRDDAEKQVTINNLKKFNFPFADNDHVFLKTTISSKEERRRNIEANHSVVMLLGDNLADFNFLFDIKNAEQRMQNVNALANEFGDKFIVLPNVTYGDWEYALYNFNYSLTPQQKDSMLRASVISY